ncbi:cytidine deaminase family protein [Streptomyces sp. NPDC048504]|uniref:cytidine deaminase family protein n=1 Tax=Streptomyces sp. NPDC048504 TaxID=3365559 RepID=UPI003721799E
MSNISAEILQALSREAWAARNNARVHGPTRVGCAALSEDGQIFSGCNIEHRFRSHDIHAEVNAISTLVATGRLGLVAVLIAAERDRFTPCGSCMDWIFEIGGDDCLVLSERRPGIVGHELTARELMPFYPR